MRKEPKIGTVNIPDRSNGPITIKQPKNCHCHCLPVITNAWYEGKDLILELDGGVEHKHYRGGGWYKDEECLICNPNLKS